MIFIIEVDFLHDDDGSMNIYHFLVGYVLWDLARGVLGYLSDGLRR